MLQKEVKEVFEKIIRDIVEDITLLEEPDVLQRRNEFRWIQLTNEEIKNGQYPEYKETMEEHLDELNNRLTILINNNE